VEEEANEMCYASLIVIREDFSMLIAANERRINLLKRGIAALDKPGNGTHSNGRDTTGESRARLTEWIAQLEVTNAEIKAGRPRPL
jgi:hypothetical protein